MQALNLILVKVAPWSEAALNLILVKVAPWSEAAFFDLNDYSTILLLPDVKIAMFRDKMYNY
jgi:hypothetical protein